MTSSVRPFLYAITDAEVALSYGWRPRELARAYLAGGARLIQVRGKGLPSGALLTLVDEIVADAQPCGARIIVNDRADIACLAGATGVHVGQDDLDPRSARRIVGAAAIVGFSTHTPEQLQRAIGQPLSYVAIGPVFPTGTKDTGYAAVGLALVRQARQTATVPVVAIGGITLDTVTSVVTAGAAGVAVITDLLAGGNPESRTRGFVTLLEGLAIEPAREF